MLLPELNDGLPLEYRPEEGCAWRAVDISDLMNQALLKGVVWISGLSLLEELPGLVIGDPGPFGKNGREPVVVRLTSSFLGSILPLSCGDALGAARTTRQRGSGLLPSRPLGLKSSS